MACRVLGRLERKTLSESVFSSADGTDVLSKIPSKSELYLSTCGVIFSLEQEDPKQNWYLESPTYTDNDMRKYPAHITNT